MYTGYFCVIEGYIKSPTKKNKTKKTPCVKAKARTWDEDMVVSFGNYLLDLYGDRQFGVRPNKGHEVSHPDIENFLELSKV